MNKPQYAERVNQYVTEYIKISDAKAVAFITLAGLILSGAGYLGVHIASLGISAENRCLWSMAIISGAGTLVSAAAVAWFCLSSLIPRTPPAGEKNLNSFVDIANLSQNEYQEKVRQLAEDSLVDHFSRHSWTLSLISTQKFDSLKLAVASLRFLVICSTTFILLGLSLASITGDNENGSNNTESINRPDSGQPSASF